MIDARRTRVMGAVAAALLLPMFALSAQECMGGLSAQAMSHAVGGTMAGAGSQRMAVAGYERLGSRVQLGAQAGFVGTSFGSTDAQLFAASASWRPGAASETGLRACPYVQAAWQQGPSDGRFESRQLQGGAGVSVGRALSFSPQFALVPFARLGVLHLRETSGFAGQTGTISRNVGEAGVGVGLRFGQQVMLTPMFNRPFATGGRLGVAEPTYSMALRFGFGR